jgi:hypothetical protein
MSSGCGDILSLEDLKTAKKHQLFEAEVITGKDGGVSSGAEIDYATNQVTGQTQKTMPAILRDIGFEPASFDFSTGGTLSETDRNKVVYDPVSTTWYSWGGTLPKIIPAGTNPVGVPGWKPQTDPNLRADIAIVSDISALMAKTADPSLSYIVKGYVPGTNYGGGIFYWDSARAKSQHNGITIFSPTVPWTGAYSTLAAFLAGTGETSSGGSGCWVRLQNSRDMLVSWGGVDISGANANDSVVKAVINYANTVKRSVRFDSGATIKCGFSSLVQHYDKFNLNLQCCYVLENISGIKIYAENDVEFNTDHPTYAERVVFRLKNCSDVEISGFNFNSSFTGYSTSVSDTTFKPQEWWKGFTAEGCSKLTISNHNVNACQVFVMADNTNLSAGLQNVDVHIVGNRFKYVTNYCIISRYINLVEFSRNKVSFNGRKWHTFGEAVAPTTQTKNIIVCDNQFTDQIAQQSCITPGPHIETGLIANNYCRRQYGIFVENGSSSNLIIEDNISISTGERADTTHILLVGEVDDQPVGGSPHSNILIQGNMFKGGGFAVQEYNTGIPLRTGFSIVNNHMIDCKMPIITNQSFIGISVSGNYMQAPDDLPDLSIAGQYPVIENNTLIGVRVRARDLGYTIVSPKIVNNIFRANSAGSVFPALIDYTDFTSMVADGNNAAAASFTDFVVNPGNANTAGFKRLGTAEGFIVSPFARFGSKLTCSLGDIVLNNQPSSVNNKYAWICVDGAAKTFGSIVIAI